MAAFSTKGLTVWLSQVPGTSPTAKTITNVTNAKPAVVTLSSTDIASINQGDVVSVAGTGIASLDGKTFIAGLPDDVAFTFALQGSDASSAPAPSTTGTVTNLQGNLVEFCLSTIDYTQSPAQAISVGTTCDPAAQIAGEPQAGSLSIAGFVDFAKPGYLEFMKAVDDQLPRTLVIRLPTTAVPSGNGAIIYPSVTATGYSESYGVNAAAAFTGEFTLGTKPTYVLT